MQSGFLAAAVSAAMATLWAGSASAVTFSYDFSVAAHTSQSGGTAVSASDFTSPDFTLNNVLDSTGFNPLFKLTIGEPVDSNDQVANAITVNFTFTAPGGADGGSIAGTTTGVSTGQKVGWISVGGKLIVDWPDSPLQINFTDGTVLAAYLQDTIIAAPAGEICTGISGWILASFKVLELPDRPPPGGPPETVPIPGALPLMLSGLALMGVVMRRRQKRRRAA